MDSDGVSTYGSDARANRMRRVRVEDYLVAIDNICSETGSELARSGQIAKALGISIGYVSTTLARLAADGLIIHQLHAGVKLTELGLIRSRRFVRRIRITELLLETLLKSDQAMIATEAHQLEPAISDKLIEAFDSYLGFPRIDGHGRPIPGPDGQLPAGDSQSPSKDS